MRYRINVDDETKFVLVVGEDSSTRQTSSSTTHSVTGPAPSAPSASMVENPANALSVSVPWIQFCVYLVYFYLPLRVSTLHICFLLDFPVLVPNLVVSRVPTLTSTVLLGIMAAESLL